MNDIREVETGDTPLHIKRRTDVASHHLTFRAWLQRNLRIVSVGGVLASPFALTASAQTVNNEYGDKFSLQWEDDFRTDGGQLNTQLWTYFNYYGPDQEAGWVDNTGLHLEVLPGAQTGDGYGISSNAAFLFGRYKTTFYSDSESGTIQAPFLVESNYGNSLDWNEIDIEIYGDASQPTGPQQPEYTLHWGPGQPGTWLNGYGDSTYSPALVTYIVDWTPNYIAWYRNGTLVHTDYNTSYKPGWSLNNSNGIAQGVEAQVFPQNWYFLNWVWDQAYDPQMPLDWNVKSAVQYSLNMQSVRAIDNSGSQGFGWSVDSNGFVYVGPLNPGGWIAFDNISSTWANISVQLSSEYSGQTIQVRTDSPTGPVIGTIVVPNTGSSTEYVLASADLSPRTSTNVFLTIPGTSSAGWLYNVYFFGTEGTSRLAG